MKLLTTGNFKLLKGAVFGYLSTILHLAPASLSGHNVCPGSSSQCRSACLNTAGRGAFHRTKAARLRKTLAFFNENETFLRQLAKDIAAVTRKAERENTTPCIRLNGTSDIRWENEKIDGKNLMEIFPNVIFYDYTALANRRNLPANYHLTFSRKENNEENCKVALKNGMNVAVVFSTKKGDALPAKYLGCDVIDGDVTDLRFLDTPGVVVGLRAKGKAKKDHSGFVVKV